MEVTERLLVNSVQYTRDGVVNIQLIQQVVTSDGRVVGSMGIEQISKPEADVIALGAASGRTDGEWGNREVEQLIRAEQMVDQIETPEIPGIPAVIDNDGKTVRDGVPAIPGKSQTMKPRFAATVIAWI